MPVSKLLPLSEAIDRFVPDDSSIAMGLARKPLFRLLPGMNSSVRIKSVLR